MKFIEIKDSRGRVNNINPNFIVKIVDLKGNGRRIFLGGQDGLPAITTELTLDEIDSLLENC